MIFNSVWMQLFGIFWLCLVLIRHHVLKICHLLKEEIRKSCRVPSYLIKLWKTKISSSYSSKKEKKVLNFVRSLLHDPVYGNGRWRMTISWNPFALTDWHKFSTQKAGHSSGLQAKRNWRTRTWMKENVVLTIMMFLIDINRSCRNQLSTA